MFIRPTMRSQETLKFGWGPVHFNISPRIENFCFQFFEMIGKLAHTQATEAKISSSEGSDKISMRWTKEYSGFYGKVSVSWENSFIRGPHTKVSSEFYYDNKMPDSADLKCAEKSSPDAALTKSDCKKAWESFISSTAKQNPYTQFEFSQSSVCSKGQTSNNFSLVFGQRGFFAKI